MRGGCGAGSLTSAAGLSKRNFRGFGKPTSTRITDRMVPALCNCKRRIRAVAKRKGRAQHESNQTSALSRRSRACANAWLWRSNRKALVVGKSSPGRGLRAVVLRVRAQGSKTLLSPHGRVVMEVRSTQRARSQPPNQPIERTLPRCALQRRSSAR